MKKFLLAYLILLLISPNLLAQKAEKKYDAKKLTRVFQEKFDGLFDNSRFPGGMASIDLPDGQVITATAGLADKEKGTRIEASDRMMSASIGKTYFAAMALELILNKKLSLDDKISKYLGEEEWFEKIPNANDVTIKQLMRHQSGIPRYILNRQVWKDATDDPDLKWKPGDQLKYVYDAKPMHPAGDGWAYSDTNYILLGLILQQVSKTDVYAYVEKRFLKPNKLTDTIPNNQRELKGLVQGYCVSFRGFGLPEKVIQDGSFVINPQMEWCGGGFLCTSGDLAKWAKIYFSGAAIEGNYLKLITENSADSARMLGPDSRYGLGVIIRKTELGLLLGHDGGFPGYTSTMGYYPQHKVAAAFMYNTDRPRAISKPAHAIMTDLVAAVLSAVNE